VALLAAQLRLTTPGDLRLAEDAAPLAEVTG
jgi:hypothetical protein